MQCNRLVAHGVFQLIVFAAVVGNTVVLALYSVHATQSDLDKLEIASAFFLWFFFAEFVLKIVGMGM
jgi:hypothetical protein